MAKVVAENKAFVDVVKSSADALSAVNKLVLELTKADDSADKLLSKAGKVDAVAAIDAMKGKIVALVQMLASAYDEIEKNGGALKKAGDVAALNNAQEQRGTSGGSVSGHSSGGTASPSTPGLATPSPGPGGNHAAPR